jgi:hypothetical protein
LPQPAFADAELCKIAVRRHDAQENCTGGAPSGDREVLIMGRWVADSGADSTAVGCAAQAGCTRFYRRYADRGFAAYADF